MALGMPKGRSLDTMMLPFGATVRSSGLRSGSFATSRIARARSARREGKDAIVTFSIGTDARSEEQSTVGIESEATRKGHDPGRQ